MITGEPEPIEERSGNQPRSPALPTDQQVTWVTIARGVFWGMWAFTITATIIGSLLGLLLDLWSFGRS